MSIWQDSKSQLSTSSLTAFGIEICTRHSKAYELVEMINFCMLAAERGLEDKVIRVFYDSNSCCCNFELSPGIEPYDEIDQALHSLAKETIGQFEWNGVIDHGALLNR